jgi:hypothetical protein
MNYRKKDVDATQSTKLNLGVGTKNVELIEGYL